MYVYKLTIFQLLNTILIPLIVSRKNTWFVRGGLVEQASWEAAHTRSTKECVLCTC